MTKIAVLFHFSFNDGSEPKSPVAFANDFQNYLRNSMYSMSSWMTSGVTPNDIVAIAAAEVPKENGR